MGYEKSSSWTTYPDGIKRHIHYNTNNPGKAFIYFHGKWRQIEYIFKE